jgi:hypothetical protein
MKGEEMQPRTLDKPQTKIFVGKDVKRVDTAIDKSGRKILCLIMMSDEVIIVDPKKDHHE